VKKIFIKILYNLFPTYYYIQKEKKQKLLKLVRYLLKRNNTFEYIFEKSKIYFSQKEFYSFEVFSLSFPKIEELGLIKIIKYFKIHHNIKFAFDIGSSIGFYSLLLSKINNVKVYSFEPFSETAKILKENIILNKSNNIILNQIAISSKKKEGTLLFDKVYSLPSNSTNILEQNIINNRNFNEKIKVVSLETFCEQNNIREIDFLKIDVEGEEYSIFENSEKLLKKFKPMIYLELHKIMEHKSTKLLKILVKNNYDVHLIYNPDNGVIFKNLADVEINLKKNSLFMNIDITNQNLLNKLDQLNNYQVFAVNNLRKNIDLNKIC